LKRPDGLVRSPAAAHLQGGSRAAPTGISFAPCPAKRGIGARRARRISDAKHRAPTIEPILPMTFREISKPEGRWGFGGNSNFDGFVKSPSVPLGAGLRFNFVVAVPEGRGPSGTSLLSFCAPCPACGGRAFYEVFPLQTFYEIISFKCSLFAKGEMTATLWFG